MRSRIRVSNSYEQRRLALVAQQVVGQTVLDLGHAQSPNPFLPPAVTTGVDLEVPRTPSGYARDLVGSVDDLRSMFPEERFDTVVAAELIEHLENPYAFLREVRQVLAPGGRLVLSTPNPLAFPTLFLELARSKRWFYTRDHLHYFLPRWVERMLDVVGFDLVRIIAVGLWLPRGYVPWCPIWASYQVVYVARARAASLRTFAEGGVQAGLGEDVVA